MQLHGAASQKEKIHCIAATVAGEAEQNQPRMPGLNQQLQNSYCYPGSSSTPSGWAFLLLGIFFCPGLSLGLLSHTELCLLAYYHTKTRECLSFLLEMGNICLRTEKVMKYMLCPIYALSFFYPLQYIVIVVMSMTSSLAWF